MFSCIHTQSFFCAFSKCFRRLDTLRQLKCFKKIRKQIISLCLFENWMLLFCSNLLQIYIHIYIYISLAVVGLAGQTSWTALKPVWPNERPLQLLFLVLIFFLNLLCTAGYSLQLLFFLVLIFFFKSCLTAGALPTAAGSFLSSSLYFATYESMKVYIRTHTHTHIHTYIHTYIHTHIYIIHIRIRISWITLSECVCICT